MLTRTVIILWLVLISIVRIFVTLEDHVREAWNVL